MDHHLVTLVALIGVAGVGAQWLAWKTGIPAIVALLAVGIAAGPGFGLLDPAESFGDLLQPLIGLAVAIIVFEGGLNLDLRELRAAGSGIRRLVLLALPLSWGLGALAAHHIGGLSWPVAILFGAILVVTGPTVIIPLLRQARLHERPAAYLKWEGIVNDPIGAVLAVLVLEFLAFSRQMGEEAAAVSLAWTVGGGAAVGIALGVAVPYAIRFAFRRSWAPEILKTPILLASVLGIYVAADAAQKEAGLIGATVFGVVLGNMGIPGLAELRRFKESLTVFLVSGLFIILSANLEPATIARVSWPMVAATAAILFLVRPAAILLSTLGDRMSWRERALVAWIAPRGIVAAAVAGIAQARLREEGVADADLILPMVFSVIVATVVLHGLTIGPLARALGLAATAHSGLLLVGSAPWLVGLAEAVRGLGIPVTLADRSPAALAEARRRGVRSQALEVLSERGEEMLDLLETNHVLAATADDAYNALVCTRFAPEIGRENVHQTAPRSGGTTEPDAAARDWRGKVVLGCALHHAEIERLHREGWRFRALPYRDPRTLPPSGDAFDLLVAAPGGHLVMLSAETEVPLPNEGVLLRFAPPPADAPDTRATGDSAGPALKAFGQA